MAPRSQHHRHLPFLVALGCGAAALIVLYLLAWNGAVVGAACLFFLTYLVLTAARIPRFTASYLKANAASTDEPAAIIFLITLGTVVTSLVCLFAILHKEPGSRGRDEVLLSLATVVLGWLTIHTMAALHYAHLYWRPEDHAPKQTERHRGLMFPECNDPGAAEFLYFAFVIGMTAQTSDVQIESTAMRKFALLHGIVSFLFNTVLVAVAVNVAVAGWAAQQAR